MRYLFCLCLFIHNLALADTNDEDTLVLALTMIKGVMEPRTDNVPYNRFLTYLAERSGIQLKRGYYPSGRSNFLLETGKIDCIFPIAEGAYRRDIKTIYSTPVNQVTTHLFSFTDVPFPGLEAVRGKTVVYQRGYLFGNLVKSSQVEVDFVPVINPKAALELLKKERAVAYMEYLPDLRFSLDEKYFSQLSYAKDSPIKRSFDVFECRSTEQVAKALGQINQIVLDARASGELKAILGKYYNL